ncbi:MAG TPA: c-type cytochrome biogenesis protein CcmI, partial [Rhodopila sp.]
MLAFGALLPIVAPLLRGNRPVAARAAFDQAVYRDQLQELDRDIVRGLITPA